MSFVKSFDDLLAIIKEIVFIIGGRGEKSVEELFLSTV